MLRRAFCRDGSALAALGALGCGASSPPLMLHSNGPRVVDLMPEFFAYWDRAARASVDVQKQAFFDEIVARHPELYAPNVIGVALREGSDSLSLRLDRWLPLLPTYMPEMRRIHARFVGDLEGALAHMQSELPSFAWRGDLYVYVSVDAFNGAGRPVQHGDAMSTCLLFGVDVLAKMGNTNPFVIIHHELFHMHQRSSAAMLGEQMWVEGLATYASIVLNPGTTDDEALPVTFLHDPSAPVLDAPDRRISFEAEMPRFRAQIIPMMRERLRATEENATEADYAMFFLGRAAPIVAGMPVRTAYWLGLQLVRALARGRSLETLSQLEPASLIDDMDRELAAMV